MTDNNEPNARRVRGFTTTVHFNTEEVQRLWNNPLESFEYTESQVNPEDEDETQAPDDVDVENNNANNDDNDRRGDDTVRTRSKKSVVWKYFKFQKDVDNNGIACCTLCDSVYKFNKGGGTGTLSRHLARAHADKMSELEPNFTNRVTGQSFTGQQYDHEIARMAMAKLVIREELPFNFCEKESFLSAMHEAYNPNARHIPRSTMKGDITRTYNTLKQELISTLTNLTSSVCLTADIWTARTLNPFMCITCHWLDDDWEVQKRIIDFSVLDYPHDGPGISDRIMAVCNEFGIFSKVFSITLDNASSNTSAINYLQLNMNPSFPFLFHVRCNCHILHLFVTDAINVAKPYIEEVRKCIVFAIGSPKRRQFFKEMCRTRHIAYKKIPQDVPHRWNSTHDMLSVAMEFKNALHDFCMAHNMPRYCLTPAHWDWVEGFVTFMAPFKEATYYFSQVYASTTTGTLPFLVAIMEMFNYGRDQTFIQSMAEAAEEKFLKYYHPIPLIYSISAIFDPRIKMEGLVDLFAQFYNNCNPLYKNYDYSGDIVDITNKLNLLYTHYERKYMTGNIRQSARATSSSSRQGMTSKQFKATKGIFSMLASKRQKSSTSGDQLSYYLNSNRHDPSDYSLDVAKWWRSQTEAYPILSIMARDILTPPTSTIASESAFSTSGRVLDDTRCRLTPQSLRMLMCSDDWIEAAQRSQGQQKTLWETSSSGSDQ